MKNVITTSQHKQKEGVLLKYFSHSLEAGKVFISKILILTYKQDIFRVNALSTQFHP